MQQVVDHADLVGDLGTAQNGDQGTLGVIQGLAHELQLLLHQQTGDGGQVVGYALGGGVGTVGSAKGVEDKDVGQGSQLLGKFGVVLLLFEAEAQVLHQHDLAGLEGGALGLGVGAEHVLGQGHGHLQ